MSQSETVIVALSGSLRRESANGALLRAIAALAPAALTIRVQGGLGDLPAFDPDLDGEGASPPVAVANFRSRLTGAHGFLISSPEYAHGVPGAFKNALDWLVSSGELEGKPVLLVQTTPGRGDYAQAQLREVLRTMGARVLDDLPLPQPFSVRSIDSRASVSDLGLRRGLQELLAALLAACVPAADGRGTEPALERGGP